MSPRPPVAPVPPVRPPEPPSRRPPRRRGPLRGAPRLLGLLFLAGCTGETVVVAGGGGDSAFLEHEPNDDAWSADFVGGLRVGDAVAIRGHVTDGALDPFDGFAFEVEEPLVLVAELDAHSPFADLDLCVYDPVADVFVACFEGPDDPEVGSVAIGLPVGWYDEEARALVLLPPVAGPFGALALPVR